MKKTPTQKAAIEAAMREDAEKMAPYSLDILKEFEPHAIEVLMRETEWKE